ncbi:hypothetical protein H4R34_004093 [Dimargaris verticillata]|uniref:DNA 5'-3' helicase n=1 Tax=Dimargaris verticillata TaxID=2761393 RepID=A0A9W8B0W4_9FUNG|nr:hypothetical protein H4R34_004093 [Dimargaris verticillata]
MDSLDKFFDLRLPPKLAAKAAADAQAAEQRSGHTFPIAGVPVRFPFQPYPAQLAMMAKIITALNRRENALLESPTGSGKSLALLCSALGWLEKRRSQVRQLRVEHHQARQQQRAQRLQRLFQQLFPGNTAEDIAAIVASPTIVSLGNRLMQHRDFVQAVVASNSVSHEEVTRVAQGGIDYVVPTNTTDQDIATTPKTKDPSPPVCTPSGLDFESFTITPPDPATPTQTECPSPKVRKLSKALGLDRTSSFSSNSFADDAKNAANIGGGFIQSMDSILDGPSTVLTQHQAQTILKFTVPPPIRKLPLKTLRAFKTANPSVKHMTDAIARASQTFGDLPCPWSDLLSWNQNMSDDVAQLKRSNSTSGDQFWPFQELELPEAPAPSIPKIYFGTRTHKQIAQVVKELRANSSYRPRMAILSSRKHTCINKNANKAHDVNERCRALREEKKCHMAHRVNDLIKQVQKHRTMLRVWDIEDLVTLGRSTGGCPYYATRELAESAEIVFCPYNYLVDPSIREASGIDLKNSIIVIDEAHNIEDVCRSSASLTLSDLELEEVSRQLSEMIRDGEHYHEDFLTICCGINHRIRDDERRYNHVEYERSIEVRTGTEVIAFLEEISITAMRLAQLKLTLERIQQETERRRKENAELSEKQKERAEEPPEDGNELDKGPKLLSHLTEMALKTLASKLYPAVMLLLDKLKVLLQCRLLLVFGYVLDNDMEYLLDYRLGIVKRKWNEFTDNDLASKLSKPTRSFTFEFSLWCMNPGVVFRSVVEQTHSVILTSGTLSPMNTFMSELQTSFHLTLEANHVIQPNQIWVGAIPVGPANQLLKGVHATANTLEYQDDIGRAILRICQETPQGVLCFMPSYGLIEKMISRWTVTDLYTQLKEVKDVFQEPQQASQAKFEQDLKQYHTKIRENMAIRGPRNGAILFAVYRGKVSEGIDFSDEACRAVINIGIPFPHLMDVQVKLKQQYNDQAAKHGAFPRLTGKEWYTTQAYRAVNQALGRCIRHRNDWGAVIFLECRLTYRQNAQQLSRWVRGNLRSYPDFDDAMNHLQQFMYHWTQETITETDLALASAERKLIEALDNAMDEVIVVSDS